MNENKKVPKIRFPEFSGDWEEKKLGEVACYRNGKAHEQLICSDGKYIVVNSKFISTNGKTKKFSNTQIEPLYKDEITFVLSDIPNGKAIAKTFLIETDQKYTLNQRIAGINTLENNYPYYMYVLMNRNKYFLKFDDGVNQTNISKKDVENWKEYYPTFEEQQKIGNFFKKLDESISLQKNKIDNLKLQKKALLQKMFPKNGETVPEIRFPEFSGDWEEKKFGEVASINSGKDYKFLDSGDVPVYGTGGYMLSVNGKLSDCDGIGIGRKGTIDKPQYLKAPFWTVDTLFFLIPFDFFNINFLFLLTQKINWKSLDESTGVPSLSKSSIKNLTQTFPTLQEQQKIGNFFKKLDTLILLNQQKLENLEKRRKGLLQKMFV